MDRTALYVPATVVQDTSTNLVALRSGYSLEEYNPPLLDLQPSPTEDRGERRLIALVGKAGTGKHTYLRDYYSKKGPLYIPYASGFIEQSGMHPVEQREYMEWLKGVSTGTLLRKGDTSELLPNPYMFVTYSPYIVDEMGSPENVILFHKSKGGRYYRAPLTSHPNIKWGMQTLTVGEFWDAEGESWLEEHGEDVTFQGV